MTELVDNNGEVFYVVAYADEHSSLVMTKEEGEQFLHTFESLDDAYDFLMEAEGGIGESLVVLKMKKDDVDYSSIDGVARHRVGKASPSYLRRKSSEL